MRTVATKLRIVLTADEPSEAAPDALWPLGDEVATALLGLLEVELRARGLRWRVVARDELEVGRTDAPWPGAPLYLRTLCERMRRGPKADWPDLIEQYVHGLRNTDEVRSLPRNGVWAQMREPLRSRILAADPANAALSGALVRTAADGLVEAVVTEAGRGGPHSATGAAAGGEPVSAGEALGWGVAERAVFEAARANVRGGPRLEAERFTIDGTGLLALFGPTHYAATHVLWLSDYLAGTPGWNEANGALVVLPHRHLIAVHPIESAAVIAAAGTLLRFGTRQYETCPGPLSDQLYWWHGGELDRLPSDSVGETLQVFPSDRFAALLERLRGAG
jgi:hypothetical protein